MSCRRSVFGAPADGLPRIRVGFYRLAPASRRPRVIALGDEIVAKVDAYVLGYLRISVISGGARMVLLISACRMRCRWDCLSRLLDLIPVVGSTVAGIVVVLVALTVSPLVALSTAGFFVGYRLVEDYLLAPKVIGRWCRSRRY